jgi:anti-anti-sigma regulatory factor
VLDAVLAAQTGLVVLDLRALTLVDATGLQLLIEAEARSSTSARRVSFIAGPAVARLFDLLGLPVPLTYRADPRHRGRAGAEVMPRGAGGRCQKRR